MRAAVAAAVGLLAAARPAAADEERGPWYGWQILLADAAAAGLLFKPTRPEAGPITRGMGMTTLLMAPPIIHMAHRNARSASVTLLRIPAVLLGHIAGSALAGRMCGQRPSCAEAGGPVGATAVLLPIVAFDLWTAFAPSDWTFW